MSKLVRDHQMIALERWKALMKSALTIGMLFLGVGLFNIFRQEWNLGWLATCYVVIGPVLLATGVFLLVKGPRIPAETDSQV
jgi:uncharacterized membrane protein